MGMALLSSSNLLYHFPLLLVIFARVASGLDPGDDPLSSSDFRARIVEPQVLVRLVGDDEQVVRDRDSRDLLELLAREHDARRVVRGVQQYEPGARRDGGPQCGEVGPQVRTRHGHADSRAVGEGDARRVDVEPWLEEDDLVTSVDECEECGLQDLGGSGTDHDVGDGFDVQPVEASLMLRDRLAQRPFGQAISALQTDGIGIRDLAASWSY